MYRKYHVYPVLCQASSGSMFRPGPRNPQRYVHVGCLCPLEGGVPTQKRGPLQIAQRDRRGNHCAGCRVDYVQHSVRPTVYKPAVSYVECKRYQVAGNQPVVQQPQ
jgi:hypothetical protein